MISSIKKLISGWNEKTISLEKVFLISAIVFGIGYMAINSPNSVYDERAHFVSAYHYSDVLMGKPFSMEDGSYEMRNEDVESLSYSIYSGPGMFEKMKENFSFFQKKEGNVTFAHGVAGNFLQFFPQALGITIGRVLHLGHLPVYYLGRIMNLAAYILLSYFAIKLIPFGKCLLFMIALLPISMNEAASLNYDAVLYGISFLYTALVFKAVYEDRKLTWKDFWILFAVIWCLAAQKMGIYIILGGLIFLIPKDNFNKKSQWLLFIGGLCLAFILSVAANDLTYYFLYPTGGTDALEEKDPVVLYSISDLLSDPLHFLGLIGPTLMEKGNYYIMSAFGGRLGHFDVGISDTYIWEVIMIMAAGAVISPAQERSGGKVRPTGALPAQEGSGGKVRPTGALPAREESGSKVRPTGALLAQERSGIGIRPIRPGHKVWFIVLFLLEWMAYWVVFFFTFTPKDETIIWGVQGRYFIPLMILPFLCLKSGKGRFKRNRDNTVMALFLLMCILIFSMAALVVITQGDAARNLYGQ